MSSLVYLTPPATLLLGFLTFGDVLAWTDVLGLSIAALGVGIVYRGETAPDAVAPLPSDRSRKRSQMMTHLKKDSRLWPFWD